MVVAVVAALSALGLFLVRSDLADTRASLADTRASRDSTWNNYLLSEQRGTAAAVLIAARDPLGVAEAVAHTRGAFTAISAAADEEIPARADRLLGADGPLHESRLALDLAAGQHDVYNTLKEDLAPLQGRTLENIEAHRKDINRLEERIRLLTNGETAMFLLTVLCALLLNVSTAKKEGE